MSETPTAQRARHVANDAEMWATARGKAKELDELLAAIERVLSQSVVEGNRVKLAAIQMLIDRQREKSLRILEATREAGFLCLERGFICAFLPNLAHRGRGPLVEDMVVRGQTLDPYWIHTSRASMDEDCPSETCNAEAGEFCDVIPWSDLGRKIGTWSDEMGRVMHLGRGGDDEACPRCGAGPERPCGLAIPVPVPEL